MFFRFINTNPSINGWNTCQDNDKKYINDYFCMVKSLTRAKVDFLCLLHHYITQKSFIVEEDQIYWLPKTFEKWAKELGIAYRKIQRIITFLHQENIILIKKLASHKTIRTNYYTINYPKLWVLISASCNLFVSPYQGDVA